MQTAIAAADNNSSSVDGKYLPYEKLHKQFLDWANVKRDETNEQREARRYYHGDHYTEGQRKTLNKRKQPIVTYNRIGKKIDGIVGLLERLRQDAKAYPRTPQHEEGAEIASISIRYALDNVQWAAHSAEAER